MKYSEKTTIADSALEDHFSSLTVTSDPFKDVPILSRTTAELYLFDTETDVFVIQEKEVNVDMASNDEYDSELDLDVHALIVVWIIVRQTSTPFMSMPIDAEMNPRFDMVGSSTRRSADSSQIMPSCSLFERVRVYPQ